MTHKAVHLLSLFLMVYIGVEVTIGGIICSLLRRCFKQKLNECKSGWTASFLMLVRGGGPSSGYVSTGFFGGKYPSVETLFIYLFIKSGLTLGRIILFPITDRVCFISYSTISSESKGQYSLEPLKRSMFIPSSRYCKSSL
jgi:fucose permease